MFAGKTFYSPLQVLTDIHGGGHFFYITYKKKLQFYTNGYVEFSYKVIEYHWSWPDIYKDVLFSGIYNEPGSGHYTLDCDLSNVNETQMKIAGLLTEAKTLLCHVYIRGKGGNSTYLSELYFLDNGN